MRMEDYMPITVQGAQPIANRWNIGRCVGFRQHPSTNSIVGYFKLEGHADNLSMKFGDRGRVKIPVINELRAACGLPPLGPVESIVLPEVGDNDMAGYDAIIEIFAVEKGKYTNAAQFRKLQSGGEMPRQTQTQNGSSAPQPVANSEDPF